MQPQHEVSDVLNAHWSQVQSRICGAKLNSWQLRTLHAVRLCRTAALGAHVECCTACGHLRISYNSCRNRHCPKCQGNEREKWIQAREKELLPVPYFHLVFTLPDILNQLCLQTLGFVFFQAGRNDIRNLSRQPAFASFTAIVNRPLCKIFALRRFWVQLLFYRF